MPRSKSVTARIDPPGFTLGSWHFVTVTEPGYGLTDEANY